MPYLGKAKRERQTERRPLVRQNNMNLGPLRKIESRRFVQDRRDDDGRAVPRGVELTLECGHTTVRHDATPAVLRVPCRGCR